MSNQIGGDPPPASAGIDLKKFFESRKKEAIWSRFLSSPPTVGDHVWVSLRELLCYVGRTCACVREKGVSEVVVKACFFSVLFLFLRDCDLSCPSSNRTNLEGSKKEGNNKKEEEWGSL